jgi:PAS domain S-box-containing protein
MIRDLAEMSHRLAECERLLAVERRESQRLRESEELYRQLVENSQGLICKHDLAGNLLYVSPASAVELGYPPEAGVMRNLREFLAPSVRPFFDAYLRRIREKEADRGLLRLVSREGEERLWAYRNVLHRVPDAEPYVVGHAVDITDRVRAESLLRESEARHRAVIDTLEEGVLVMAADGSVKGWNPSAGRILGLSSDQIPTRASEVLSADAIREDGSPLPREACPDAIALWTGRPCSDVVIGIRRPDGTLAWISVSSRPLTRPEEGVPYGVVVSFVDVTDRRRGEPARDHHPGAGPLEDALREPLVEEADP